MSYRIVTDADVIQCVGCGVIQADLSDRSHFSWCQMKTPDAKIVRVADLVRPEAAIDPGLD